MVAPLTTGPTAVDCVYVRVQALCPALLNVREMCWRISDVGLCRIDRLTYTLADFKAAQIDKQREVVTTDNNTNTNHRRVRAQSTLGGQYIFARKSMYEKLTKCPDFT